jgi:outer membrane protein TolC
MKTAFFFFLATLPIASAAQTVTAAQPSGNPNAPAVLTLQDALENAKKLDPTYRAALTDAGVAHEEHVIARASLLPGIQYNNQYLYTEGTGTTTPRFIANNAVHEYVSQANAHEVVSGAQFADFARTGALAAVAKARAEIAARGLVATVVKTYYAEVIARRKYSNAQLAAAEAKRFFDLSQKLEAGGEVAHSDTIKANLQSNEAQRGLREAELEMNRSHIELAVLVFADFNQNFSTVDDLQVAPPLPTMDELERRAKDRNPQLYAAMQALRASGFELKAARAEYLPTLSLDYFYGIDSPQFSAYSTTPDGRIRNLGYSASATLNIPIWNWGATHARVKEATLQHAQARVELSAAQRELLGGLRAMYAEADAARSELDSLRQSVELADQSVRLTNLRYQAGEATALEVVDAQNTLVTARNNYDDGQARYRLAIANLQTVTGSF